MVFEKIKKKPALKKIRKDLVGEPVTVGARIIRPVARLAGWYGSSQVEMGPGRSWLRAIPTEVIVQEGENEEKRIPIRDGTRVTLRTLVFSALAIAIACQLLILYILRESRNRS